MKILPETFEQALDLVYKILNQGDSRYNDSESEIILARFILMEIVSLEENTIPEITLPEKIDSHKMGRVQIEEKYLAKLLLNKEGFNDDEIFFERMFLGSRSDVLGEKENKIIPIECCSCRVNKILDYLSEVEEVWIITRAFSNEESRLFIFKRGPEWDKILIFEKYKAEELKKIPSPLDNLMGVKENDKKKLTT